MKPIRRCLCCGTLDQRPGVRNGIYERLPDRIESQIPKGRLLPAPSLEVVAYKEKA